jgi:hypothetical protein
MTMSNTMGELALTLDHGKNYNECNNVMNASRCYEFVPKVQKWKREKKKLTIFYHT